MKLSKLFRVWSHIVSAVVLMLALGACNTGDKTVMPTPVSRPVLLAVDADLLVEIDLAAGQTINRSHRGLKGYRNITALAYNPSLDVLYALDTIHNQFVSIEPDTGAVTAIEGIGFNNASTLAFNDNTNILYSINQITNELISIDVLTGEHVHTASVDPSLGAINSLAFDPNTNTLYGVSVTHLMTIDAISGIISLVAPLSQPYISGLAFDPNTNSLFGARTVGFEYFLYSINTYDATVTEVGRMNKKTNALVYDSTRRALFGFEPDSYQLLSVDPSTGVATVINALGFSGPDLSLTFGDGVQVLYGMSWHSQELLKIDLTSGIASTLIQYQNTGFRGLAYSPAGNVIYTVDTNMGNLVAITPETGVQSVIGGTALNAVYALAFDPRDGLLYGVDIGADVLLRIDPATGMAAPVGALNCLNVASLAFEVSSGVLFGLDSASGSLVEIDTNTAACTRLGQTWFGSTLLQGLAFNAVDDTLYSTSPTLGSLLKVNKNDGSYSTVGTLGYTNVKGLVYASQIARSYGVVSDSHTSYLIEIDHQTGNVRTIGDIGFFVTDLVIDPRTGQLYSAANDTYRNDLALLVIDENTGAGSVVAPLAHAVYGLAYDLNRDIMYGTTAQYGGELVRIDKATGAIDVVARINSNYITNLTYDPRNAVLYGLDTYFNQLISIDIETGETTLVLKMPYGLAQALTVLN